MSEQPGLNYQEEGRRLLTALYGSLSALRLYPVENETVQQSLTELHALMDRIVAAEIDAGNLVVTDDLGCPVPTRDRELDAIERYLGAEIDQLLRLCK